MSANQSGNAARNGPERPASLDYSKAIESPNFAPESPNGNVVHSPAYDPSSPVYNPNTRSHSRASSPREQRNEREITITDALHIPRWATGFVLGGRDNKHLENICRRHGHLITYVGVPTTFEQPNGQIFTIVTLIGFGYHNDVCEAMRNVKRDIFGTIKKAKQMKKDGTWGVPRRENRREDRYREDRYREDRHRGDRRY